MPAVRSTDRGFLFPAECPYEPNDKEFDAWCYRYWRAQRESQKAGTDPVARQKRYTRYLASQEWRETANAAKQRAGFKCERCGSPDSLQVHHKTYENLGYEKDSDLIVLCCKCHFAEHRGRE